MKLNVSNVELAKKYVHITPDFRDRGGFVRTLTIRNPKVTARHLRVVAKNPGPLPEWHLAKGNDSWLFCDEVIVE